MTAEIVDPQCVRELKQHKGAVLNVKFTANGAYCMSTSQDKSVILWNPIKGLAIKEYRGPHNHEINDVSITSDNSRFVTCGGDRSAFLWDVTSGEVFRKFSGHEGKINCCEIAADDGLLLTGCYDKCVRLWDMKASSTYKPIQTFSEAKDSISSIAVTAEKRILTTAVDGCLRVYDLRAGRLHTDQLSAPAVRAGLSSDDRCISVNCLDNAIHLLEIDSGQHLNTYRGHKNNNYALNSEIDPTNTYVVSGSEDGRIVVWDICGEETKLQKAESNQTSHVVQVLSPDNTSIPVTTSSSLSHRPHWGCVFTVRFHPTQWVLISCHNDNALRVWNKRQSKHLE